MKPFDSTNDDLVVFLASKKRREVYQGFSELDILLREKEIWRLWIYAYTSFGYIAAVYIAMNWPGKFLFYGLLPIPTLMLMRHQRRVEDFLIYYLTRPKNN